MKKILLFLFFSITSFAQTLDTTFDTDGIVKSQLSNTPSTQIIYDAVLQPDGKMIYVGSFDSPFTKSFVARYNTSGSKDNTFNQYGFKTFNLSTFQTVYLQSDGKILVAGQNAITRLLTNGNLDMSFSTDGTERVSLGGFNMNIKSIAVQSDNKIVVCGYISNGINNDFAVARLNTDGTLDTTFDTDGILVVPVMSGNDQAFSLKIQTDGNIVIAGESHSGTNYDFALVRITASGLLDTTFGIGGKTITAIGTAQDYGRSLEILSDGRILVLGSSSGKFVLASYTASGVLDTSFDSDGKLMLVDNITSSTGISAGSLHFMPRLKVLSNNKILISGRSNFGAATTDYKVIKLEANGAFDITFDADGVLNVDVNNFDYSVFLLLKPSGRIVTGGFSYDSSNPTDFKIKHIEINTDGSIFSNTTRSLYLGFDSEVAMKLLPDGKILVLANLPEAFLLKYNSDGSIDTTFGDFGISTVITNSFNDDQDQVLFIQDNGKIWVTGDYTLTKFNSDGFLDTTFDGDGLLDLAALTVNRMLYLDKIYILPNGQIYVAFDYDSTGTGNSSFGILKLNADGTLDTTFGVNGYFTTRFNPDQNNFLEIGREMFIQSDNKIVVMGYSSHISGTDRYLASLRLNPNGTLDSTYGVSGKSYMQLATNNFPYDSVLLSDDKFIITDYASGSGSVRIKFTKDGLLDTTYGVNGIANNVTGFGIGYGFDQLVIQPDGKILQGGSKNNQFAVARYNTDGSVDTTFGNNGELNTVIDFTSNIGDIALQLDGKLLVAGNSFNGDNQVITLARYTDVYLGTLDFNAIKNNLLIYPNPIESATTFEFTLNESALISIEVYDMQGKLVQTIVKDKEYSAGSQKLPIQLNQFLTTGNYILKIASPKGSQSIQILKK